MAWLFVQPGAAQSSTVQGSNTHQQRAVEDYRNIEAFNPRVSLFGAPHDIPAATAPDQLQMARFEASVAPASALALKDQVTVLGAITPAGTVSTTRLAMQSFGAVVSPASAVGSQTRKTLLGTVSPASVLVKQVAQLWQGLFTGARRPASAIVKFVRAGYAGLVGLSTSRDPAVFNTFEGGVPGDDVVAAGSGGASGYPLSRAQVSGAATLKYSNEGAHGGVAVEFDTGGGTEQAFVELTTPSPGLDRTGRGYLRIRGGAGLATSSYSLSPDVVYDLAHGLKADVYVPKLSRLQPGPFPVIVTLHGLVNGVKEQVTQWIVPRNLTSQPWAGLVGSGGHGRPYAVVNANYRYSPAAFHPAQVTDIVTLLGWIQAHAAQYHFDPTRVYVVGGSGGGRLAGLIGVDHGGLVNAVASLSGVLDYPLEIQLGSASAQAIYDLTFGSHPAAGPYWPPPAPYTQAGFEAASPYYRVGASTAPTYLASFTTDPAYVQLARNYHGALAAAGVANRYDEITGIGHAFPLLAQLVGADALGDLMLDFLGAH